MRYSILLTAFIILGTITMSCNKEYTCVCSNGFLSSKTEEVTIKARDKDNARNKCIDKGGGVAGSLSGKSCSLKE